jgi:hypothetical protein
MILKGFIFKYYYKEGEGVLSGDTYKNCSGKVWGWPL